jgi:hypothetical protein
LLVAGVRRSDAWASKAAPVAGFKVLSVCDKKDIF